MALVVVVGFDRLFGLCCGGNGSVGALEFSVVAIRRVGKCPDFLVGGTLSSLHGGWSSEGASFGSFFSDIFAREEGIVVCF